MVNDTRAQAQTHTQVPVCTILSQIMNVRSRSLKKDGKENLHNLAQLEAQNRIKKRLNVRGEWIKFINEDLYGLYFSLNLTSVVI